MAVKAVARVVEIYQQDATNFKLNIRWVGMVAPFEDGGFVVEDIDPTIAAVTLETAIKTAVKDYLIANKSYTFGLFDTVRLIGALL